MVNRNDLIAALDSGHLSHAVLDVFEQEPLSTSSELWHHPKITITPHVSAPTNKKTACEIVSQNIARFFETGELPETVNISLGY